MDDAAKLSALERVAGMARARVADALKSTVEREVVEQEMAIADLPPQHSKFEHVVAQVNNIAAAQRADQSLAASMWGSESESQIMAFAERLAKLKVAQASS